MEALTFKPNENSTMAQLISNGSLGRHSGGGWNPANSNSQRSGQNCDVVPLRGRFFNHLDTGLRRYDVVIANGLFDLIRHIIGALAVALLLAACATTTPEFAQGKRLLEEGKVDEGLAVLEKLANKDPKNAEYRSYYFRQREAAVNALLMQAGDARRAGHNDEAEKIYRHILEIDKGNRRAELGLAELDQERRQARWLSQAEAMHKSGQTPDAREKLRAIFAENPRHPGALRLQKEIEQSTQLQRMQATPLLHTRFKKPITLEFREAPVKAIFDVLSQSSDINFIIDKDVRPDLRASVVVRNTTLDEVLEMLLTTNHLEKKILNDNTILIYPATPEKKREYQDLVLKSFYLENADAKQVSAMIKTMVKTKDVFVDEKLNLVIMRDTPDAVRFAEQLVAMQDKAEPEVMLEVEVLEVSTNRLLNLGINYPAQVSYGIKGAAGTPGSVTLPELRNGVSNLISLNLPNPALVANLQQQDGDTKLLANPRIRVKNREKAKIHIGDRVPVITTTAATGGGFVSESVSYLDVGLKLDVEPTIYLEGDVGIKVGLEVSNIVNEVTGKTNSNTLTYQIGTRNANTVLRLHDGETQILAGLISDEDRNSANKVPGLGDFPLLGRLFSSHNDTRNKTEIVLLITPHVVRNIMRPEAEKTEFSSGSEATVGRGLRLSKEVAEPTASRGIAPAETKATAQPSPTTQPVLTMPEPAPVPVPTPAAP